MPERDVVEAIIIPITERSNSSLNRTQGIGDMYRMYAAARREGLDFNLAFIPDEFDQKRKKLFDPQYMRKLFDLGCRMAATKYPWHKAPPGFD